MGEEKEEQNEASDAGVENAAEHGAESQTEAPAVKKWPAADQKRRSRSPHCEGPSVPSVAPAAPAVAAAPKQDDVLQMLLAQVTEMSRQLYEGHEPT